MLKSNASRGVLVILLVIAAFELGISGKVGQLWTLAFNANPNKSGPPPANLNPGGLTFPPPVIA